MSYGIAGIDNQLLYHPILSYDEYDEILARSRKDYCYQPDAPQQATECPDPIMDIARKKKQKPFKKDRQKAPPIVPSEDVDDF